MDSSEKQILISIVNGPGEMADADFGYVGGAPNKINLYVGKQAIKFNTPKPRPWTASWTSSRDTANGWSRSLPPQRKNKCRRQCCRRNPRHLT
jgi:hypothetical protein